MDPPAQNSKEGKLADRLRKASASHGTVSMKQTKQMIKKQVCKLLISVFKTLIRFNVNFKCDVLVCTEIFAYSDTAGTRAKCHCKQICAYSDT